MDRMRGHPAWPAAAVERGALHGICVGGGGGGHRKQEGQRRQECKQHHHQRHPQAAQVAARDQRKRRRQQRSQQGHSQPARANEEGNGSYQGRPALRLGSREDSAS